jgi:two-component system, LytTR family, response regulator
VLIRTLIVDDEALARESIRLRLQEHPDFEIVGEAADGPAAIKAIKSLRPDLVFLDIQLPGFGGLDALRRAGSDYLPSVIFVTAHDQFAVKAFDVHAVDYLLKPVSQKRFAEAVARMRLTFAKEIVVAANHDKVVALLDQHGVNAAAGPLRKKGTYAQRLAVKDRDRFLILKIEEIDWIRSAANYVELHSKGRRFMLRTTMNDLEEMLDPTVFVRIHRETIVNVDCVSEVLPSEHGDFTVLLRDATRLRASRTYRERLLPHI